MIQSLLKLRRGLWLLLLLFPLTSAAQSGYIEEGQILSLSNNMINVSDAAYRLSPTVKVTLLENRKGDLNDLEIGNFVQMEIIHIGKKRFVDTIQVLENLQTNETIPLPR